MPPLKGCSFHLFFQQSLLLTTFVSLLHNLKPATQFDTQSLYFESPVIVDLYIKNIKNIYIKEKHNLQ